MPDPRDLTPPSDPPMLTPQEYADMVGPNFDPAAVEPDAAADLASIQMEAARARIAQVQALPPEVTAEYQPPAPPRGAPMQAPPPSTPPPAFYAQQQPLPPAVAPPAVAPAEFVHQPDPSVPIQVPVHQQPVQMVPVGYAQPVPPPQPVALMPASQDRICMMLEQKLAQLEHSLATDDFLGAAARSQLTRRMEFLRDDILPSVRNIRGG